MSKKKAEPKFSKSISDTLSIFEKALKEYEWNSAEVHRMDLLTNDYLHKLELEHLSCEERSKIATQIMRCRRARRVCKDKVEILTPLVQYLNDAKGKQMLNQMREILGQTRKFEKKMGTRTYVNRVLEE